MIDKFISLPFFHLLKHKSIQNFIFLFLIQSSNIVISLIAMPLLIQSLGVEQFGLVNLSLSVVLLANVVVGYGYNLSGPRAIALSQNNPAVLSGVISQILFSKFLLANMVCILLLLCAYFFDSFAGYKLILTFSLVLLFSEAIATTWFFQGLEKMRLVSMANIFSKLLYLLALVLFINRPEDSIRVNFFLGITAFTINGLLLLYIHYELGIKFYRPDFGAIARSWKDNIALFLSALASHISVYGGLIILSFFANASTLGMYSMAERIGMVLRMIPSIITQAAYPNASKLYASNPVNFFRFLRKLFFASMGLAFFVTSFINFFAAEIIHLIAKTEFESSISFLEILAFIPLLASLNIPNMIIILASDQKKLLFNSTWSSCIYMLVVSLVLTFYFEGIGLAYALLSTELYIFIICLILIRKKNKPIFDGFYKGIISGYRSS